MQRDRYDNILDTQSAKARDHYVAGLDLLLAGQAGISDVFRTSVEADPDFALGWVGLARGYQFEGNMAAARNAVATAKACRGQRDPRTRSHLHCMDLLIAGRAPDAYAAIRAHVEEHPRDALVAQTCSSVFGLIGFSGQPGREAEILAYTTALQPHYGEDWWMMSQHAFALCENGALDRADALIDRSLALNPRNANGAHVRSHVHYEAGEVTCGIAYLDDWLAAYDRRGYLHGHLSWHCALWALEQGDAGAVWGRIAADIAPDVSQSLPINVLTDMASLLYRAELAGLSVPPSRWTEISAYAQEFFPKASIGFVDIHAALAHAMAGQTDALASLVATPNALTGDLVVPVAEAFRAYAAGSWAAGVRGLTKAMADHARLGGSRAQRDLLELALLHGLLKLGKAEEARRLVALRRPALLRTHALAGLHDRAECAEAATN